MDDVARRKGVAKLMDPMLMAGGRTAREIAAELAKALGTDEVAKLANSVFVRLNVLKRRGFTVTKDAEGKITVSK